MECLSRLPNYGEIPCTFYSLLRVDWEKMFRTEDNGSHWNLLQFRPDWAARVICHLRLSFIGMSFIMLKDKFFKLFQYSLYIQSAPYLFTIRTIQKYKQISHLTPEPISPNWHSWTLARFRMKSFEHSRRIRVSHGSC